MDLSLPLPQARILQSVVNLDQLRLGYYKISNELLKTKAAYVYAIHSSAYGVNFLGEGWQRKALMQKAANPTGSLAEPLLCPTSLTTERIASDFN